MSKMKASWLLAAAVAGSQLSATSPSVGIELDPTVAHALSVGPPSGLAPMYRLDPQRSARSPAGLPKQPTRYARARAPGTLTYGPVVDGAGHLVVVTDGGRIAQFDAAGRLQWSVRLGAAPASGPVIASSGYRAVLTLDQRSFQVTPEGRISREFHLPYPLPNHVAPPLATFDDGLLVAHADRVVWYERAGSIRAQIPVPDTIVALVQLTGKYGLVTERGGVYAWRPGHSMEALGDLGGRVSTAVAVDPDSRIVAVVDGRALIRFDPRNRTAETLVGRSVRRLAGDLLIRRSGYLVTTTAGLAIGVDTDGQETFRVALWPQGPTSSVTAERAALLADAVGAYAFASPSGAVAVSSPPGDIRTAQDPGCADPLEIVPIGSERFALACRSGALSYYQERPEP